MGPCRVCGALAGWGFSQPGPRSLRVKRGYAWACPEHREQVEAMWRAAFTARQSSEGMQPRSEASGPVSGEARGVDQPSLDL